MNGVAAADTVDVEEVAAVSTTGAATTTCVVIIRMEDEEVTITEEVAETGICPTVVATTETKVDMEDNRTSPHPSRTRGLRHQEVQTLFPRRHQDGSHLLNTEGIRVMGDMEVRPVHHLRSARPGWAMHLHSMVVLHRGKRAVTAH